MADSNLSILKDLTGQSPEKKQVEESVQSTTSPSNQPASPSISDLVVLLRSYNYDAWPTSARIRVKRELTKALELESPCQNVLKELSESRKPNS